MRTIGAFRAMIYNELYYSKRIKSELKKEYVNKSINSCNIFIREGHIDNWIINLLTTGKTLEEMEIAINVVITNIEDLMLRQAYSSELLKNLFKN